MNNEVPPPPPPPPIPPIYVSSPPQRKSGRGWMFLSFVLLLIVGVMVLGRMAAFVTGVSKSGTGTQSGRVFEEITVENRGVKDKIAVIDVDGIISSQFRRGGYSMVDQIEDQLKMAANDSNVKAVILKVDSPGGEVMASDDISRALLQFQEKHNKPVVASLAGLAASGGYYIAAPCRWIVANELTITGSIGVIMSTFNYRTLMDKVGVQPTVFKSGKFKDMLRGSKRPDEVDPAEEEMIQDMVMETFGKFKSVVRDGRTRAQEKNGSKGKALVPNWEEYADGRILTGKTAFELGFVDQIGNFQSAVDTTKKIVGLDQAHIIRYQEPFSLSQLFSMSGKTEEQVLKIDIGLELPKLEAGRMYFLSPTVLH